MTLFHRIHCYLSSIRSRPLLRVRMTRTIDLSMSVTLPIIETRVHRSYHSRLAMISILNKTVHQIRAWSSSSSSSSSFLSPVLLTDPELEVVLLLRSLSTTVRTFLPASFFFLPSPFSSPSFPRRRCLSPLVVRGLGLGVIRYRTRN